MDRLERQAMYHPKKPGEPGMQRRDERWAVLLIRRIIVSGDAGKLADTAEVFRQGPFRNPAST